MVDTRPIVVVEQPWHWPIECLETQCQNNCQTDQCQNTDFVTLIFFAMDCVFSHYNGATYIYPCYSMTGAPWDPQSSPKV